MSEPLEPEDTVGEGVALAFGIVLATSTLIFFSLVILRGLHSNLVIGSLWALFNFGGTQLPGVTFFSHRFWKRGQTRRLKGLLITSAVFFLLDAGCVGLILRTNFQH